MTNPAKQCDHQYESGYYGDECKKCGDFIPDTGDNDEESKFFHCGGYYDGGNRCGACGNGDPLNTGEFDPVTGEQW